MKKLFATLCSALAFITCCFGQSVFQKTFYVPGNSLTGTDVLKTTDNKLLFTATYSSHSEPLGRGVLVKTDLEGNQIWTYTCDCGLIGGLNGVLELDHAYYAVGTVNTGATNFFTVLMKLDTGGNVLWSKRIGFDNYTIPVTISATPDEQLLIAGTSRDVVITKGYSYLVKTDTSGSVLWKRTYTHDANMTFDLNDITVNSDGSIYIAGIERNRASPFSKVSFIALLDATGNYLWSTNVTEANSFVRIQKLLPTAVNSCYVTGTLEGTTNKIFLSKIESSGTIASTKTYTAANGNLSLRGMEYSGNGIAFTGTFRKADSNSNSDMLVFKTTLTGMPLVSCTIEMDIPEETFDVVPFSGDGKLLLLGSAHPDDGSTGLALTFTGADLLSSCNAHSLSMTSADIEFTTTHLPLTVTSGGSITSITLNSPVVNVRDTVLCVYTTATADMQTPAITIYPNPTSGTFSITGTQLHAASELRIFDILGKEVYHKHLSDTSPISAKLDGGIYFVQLDMEKERIIRKLMVE